MKLEDLVASRIREARQALGLSQEALGILAGIDEATAKVRINQYESGKHIPPLSMIEKIATSLGKPVTWFICTDDSAELLLALSQLSSDRRAEVISNTLKLLKSE